MFLCVCLVLDEGGEVCIEDRESAYSFFDPVDESLIRWEGGGLG